VPASRRGTNSERADSIARLSRSLDDVLYAVSITPQFWHYRSPADDPGLSWLGSWSVADNLAHLAIYEEQIAAPILEAIREGRDESSEVVSVLESDYEALWQVLSKSPLDDIAARFSAARRRQIEAISSMDDALFHARSTSLWHELTPAGHSAAWVAAKTFQHTWEHGNSILQFALFVPS
jgi:hypothetical protein